MTCADNFTAERKDRPISENDARLSQRVEAEASSYTKGDFAKPKCKRRSKIAAEHEFPTYGEHHRHIARRGAVEKRGYQRPKRGLGQRHGPKHNRWASTQEFNKQGNVVHRPARSKKYQTPGAIEKLS